MTIAKPGTVLAAAHSKPHKLWSQACILAAEAVEEAIKEKEDAIGKRIEEHRIYV